MAFASYAPTQIGSIVSLFTSLRMMIGVPLLGSIIKARIFTSISMFPAPFSAIRLSSSRGQRLCIKAIYFCFRHAHVGDLAFVCESSGKINDLVTCRMAAHILNGLSARSFRQNSYFTTNVTVVDLLLNAM